MITLAKDIDDGAGNSPVFVVKGSRDVSFHVLDYEAGSLQLQYWSVTMQDWVDMNSVEASEANEQFVVPLGTGAYRLAWSGITGAPSVEVDAKVLSPEQSAAYE